LLVPDDTDNGQKRREEQAWRPERKNSFFQEKSKKGDVALCDRQRKSGIQIIIPKGRVLLQTMEKTGRREGLQEGIKKEE